jgi:glycosyltransferase 2 family protein
MTTTVTTTPPTRATRSRRIRLVVRIAVALGILVALVLRVGGAPFLHGLASIDVRSIVAALALAAIATGAAAWRWTIVSGRLGLGLRWPVAVAMYYRSQFLNAVLPGGVVGDVHRAISQGHQTGRIGGASRGIVVERSAGQVVQIVVTLVILACLGIPFAPTLFAWLAIVLGLTAVVGATVVLSSSRIRSLVRREAELLRASLGSLSVIARVTLASTVVIACHVATFAIAAVAVGARVPPLQMLTLALVVLLAAAVPLNIGGWGPREGVAGWAFAVAGLSGTAGIAASTLFGVLALIGVAPGLLVTLVSAARRAHPREEAA